MAFESDLAQLAADTALLHRIIHGGVSETVTTEGGKVPTAANAIAKIGNTAQFNRLNLAGIPEFSSNTAAINGGLVEGDIYRNGGNLQFVVTSSVTTGDGETTEPTPLYYYYVDDRNGNDSWQGTKQYPWKTVGQVNRTTLLPGSAVFFAQGGVWNETLYAQSGTALNPIVFSSYNLSGGVGEKPRMTAFYATGKTYAKACGIDFSTANTCILIDGSNHITVDGCTINCTATGWTPGVQLRNNAEYNAIINNQINHLTSAMNDAINLRVNANRNLIMNNQIVISTIHAAISLEGTPEGTVVTKAEFNVIKGNTITGLNGSGTLINICGYSLFNLVEDNILQGDVSNVGKTNSYALRPAFMKVVSEYSIVRRNRLKYNPFTDGTGITTESYAYAGSVPANTIGNRIYNNVVTEVAAGGRAIYVGDNGSGASNHHNVFKNNAVFGNGGSIFDSGYGLYDSDSTWQQIYTQNSASVYENRFINNLFYSPNQAACMWLDGTYNNGTYSTVAQANARPSGLFVDNKSAAPALDANFRPTTGSPCINQGAHLTTVTSANGSGTSFQVADARYFCDGYDLIEADQIQVGTQVVRIKKGGINYTTNTITIEGTTSITWTNGMTVSLPYNGSAPDIGAVEY